MWVAFALGLDGKFTCDCLSQSTKPDGTSMEALTPSGIMVTTEVYKHEVRVRVSVISADANEA